MILKDPLEAIEKQRNTLKTDRLDMSFGELMNMYEDGDLFITPEYQRAFRWESFQQTRFIESILLGIPIPPIFVAENTQSKWEVVDGLQRISTIFAFFGILKGKNKKNNSTLTVGEMIKELEGHTIETLPLKLKTTIKRSVCRVEIVRWDSQEDVRYELFNRLNTGSMPLSDQELRNCIFRAYSVDLNAKLIEIAKNDDFKNIIQASEAKQEQMFLEELALRFYAFKSLETTSVIKTTYPQFLTEFMRDVSKGTLGFNLNSETDKFLELISILNHKYGKNIFRPKGVFALHIYDSISYALPKVFSQYSQEKDKIFCAVDELLSDAEYTSADQKTFSYSRSKQRMDRALEIFRKYA